MDNRRVHGVLKFKVNVFGCLCSLWERVFEVISHIIIFVWKSSSELIVHRLSNVIEMIQAAK